MSTDKVPPDAAPDEPSADGLPDGFVFPEQPPQERGDALRAKLVAETAVAPWRELQRFFAQGRVLMAAPDVDLISVAMAVAEDNSAQFEAWLTAGQAGPVSDAQALEWNDADASVWTVVVRPWIVVQDAEAR